MTDRSLTKTVTEERADLTERLAHDLLQLDLKLQAAFVRSQQTEIERLTRERAIVNAAVTGRIANAPPVVEALQQFVRQWNACGPNSDFGRYFAGIRDIAVAALAKHQGMEEPSVEPDDDPIPHLNQRIPNCHCQGCVRLAVQSSACAYVGAPQGIPKPCTLPAGHDGPHAHALRTNLQQSGE